MPDGKRSLPESIGMPMCWIYDSKGNILTMENEYGQQVTLNQFVDKFVYRYDEENDDECRISIRVVKTSQLNNNIFLIDNVLLVEWGYILPGGRTIKSVRRKVAIRDKEKDYKADGITLELVCSDLVSYLKSIRSNTVSAHDNFDEWIREIIRGDFVATKTFKGKTKVIIRKGFEADPDPFKSNDVFQQQVRKDNDTPKDNETILTLGNQEDLNVVIKEPDLLQKGKSKAIYQEIEERLNESPDGPLHMNSRDNVIGIIKRDFSQGAYARYTYNGGSGEVITFKPKSNVQKSNDEEGEVNYVNPKTKKVETTKVATGSDFGDLPDGVSKIDVLRLWQELHDEVWEHNLSNPLDQIDVNSFTFRHLMKASSNYSTNNTNGNTSVYKKSTLFNQDKTYSAKIILQSPFFNKIRREAMMSNYIKKKVERKFEATAELIGDPSLICSKNYDFQGIADEDKGLWYSATAEHVMSPGSGYTVNLGLLKKPKRLATLLERREFDHDDPKKGSKKLDTQDLKFIDTEKKRVITDTFSEADITERINQQQLAENYYQNNNDIAFPSKRGINNTTFTPNAQDS